MKKIINMICLMIILCTGMVMVVSAEDNHNELLLYVNTDQCPKEILEFVDDNVGRFVSALCEEEGYSVEFFEIGNGFKVFNMENLDNSYYMFPISYQGEFLHLFSIHRAEDGHLVPSLSGFLAEEIKSLTQTLNSKTPITLVTYKENIYILNGNEISVLWELNEDVSIEELSKECLQELETESIFEWKEISVNTNHIYELTERANGNEAVTNGDVEMTATVPSSYYISLSRTEQQGTEPWCCAYAGAAILRTVTGITSIDAAKIVQYSGVTSSETVSQAQLMRFAKTYGISTSKATSTLSHSKVKSLISEGSPIYLGCEKQSDSKSRHALVLRGYSDSTSTYSVWNPWNKNQYFVMDKDEKVHYHTNGTSWVWDNTVYNW